jgi:hypothetical protein
VHALKFEETFSYKVFLSPSDSQAISGMRLDSMVV